MTMFCLLFLRIEMKSWIRVRMIQIDLTQTKSFQNLLALHTISTKYPIVISFPLYQIGHNSEPLKTSR